MVPIIQFNIENSMSVLKQKLDKAAEQFQTHNFKEALELYEDCLSFSYRTDQSTGVIYNIMTAKGALLTILGDFERAISVLNEVIRNDSSHYLALMRRSQLYKKKGKFNRALKDLEAISSYCPDNLQLTAMRLEIENLKQRSKNQNSSEESESEQEDQELMLNFSNLKKIDRKSISINVDKRKSRVTISGDTAFEYERNEDNEEKSSPSTSISKAQAKELYLKTFREIDADESAPPPKASNIVVKGAPRTKSILKNRMNNVSVILPEDKAEKWGGRESKLLERLKDIDGKMITSNHSLEHQTKEVQFRKSIFASQQRGEAFQVAVDKKEKKGPRKSCLKRSSFQAGEKEVKAGEKEVKARPAARRSKFESMSRNSIDGVVIRNRQSIESDPIEQEAAKQAKYQDSDGGSSYNIYGSGQQLVISREVSEQLGLGKKEEPRQKYQRGKSILKKSSVISRDSLLQKNSGKGEQKEAAQVTKKAKKSVMFTKSRFAE